MVLPGNKKPVHKGALDSRKIFSAELLQGQVAFVTGGSNGGLIKETAKCFLLHGCKAVALMSRNIKKLQAVAAELDALVPGATCIAIQGDVRKWDNCEAAVKHVVERFGKIDILLNGAAGNFLASVEKLSSNGFKSVMETDTLGVFNMSKAVFMHSMKANRSGNVINLSALLHWNGNIMQSHASAAKAGVDALTKVLAVEWGPYNIRVNGILPGAIAGTIGVDRLGSVSMMNNKAGTKEAAKKKGVSFLDGVPIPMQRLGHITDCANAALYLASPAADYITGAELVIDGGSWLTCPNLLFAA